MSQPFINLSGKTNRSQNIAFSVIKTHKNFSLNVEISTYSVHFAPKSCLFNTFKRRNFYMLRAFRSQKLFSKRFLSMKSPRFRTLDLEIKG